jgi:hypothetical protein
MQGHVADEPSATWFPRQVFTPIGSTRALQRDGSCASEKPQSFKCNVSKSPEFAAQRIHSCVLVSPDEKGSRW